MKNQVKSADELLRQGWQIGAVAGPVFYRGTQHEVTEDDLRQAAENFHRLSEETGREFVIDYDHSLDTEKELTPRERAMAAGWIKDVKVDGGKLYFKPEWLNFDEDIASGRFKGLSPVLVKNALDKKTGKPIGTYMPSVAITNKPHIDELRIEAAETQPDAPGAEGRERGGSEHETPIMLFHEIHIPRKDETVNNDKKDAKAPDLQQEITALKEGLSAVAKALGVDKADDFGGMEKAALALSERVETLKKQESEQVAGLTAKLEKLEKQNEEHLAFREKAEKESREAKIQGLIAEGKITPAEKDFYISLHESNAELFEKRVKDLKPLRLNERVVNVDREGQNLDLKVPKGVDGDSYRLEKEAEALSLKEKIPYSEALLRVSEKEAN